MSHPYVVSMLSIHITPAAAPENSKKRAKSLHCNVPLLLLIPDCIHSLLQVVEPSAIMERSCSDDPAKFKKVIKTLINLPDLKVPQAMILSRFSAKEVADLSLHCIIQQSLLARW